MKTHHRNFVATIFLFTLFLQSTAFAYTRVEIFGPTRAMIVVSEASQAQPNDPDALALFNLMNVPVQQNPMAGPGKAIIFNNQELNFTCGAKTSMGPMCNIIINPGPHVKIDFMKGQVQFLIRGPLAAEMIKLWNVTSVEHFMASDRRMSLDISSEEFNLFASTQPQ
jgi:hypothetical protein